MNFLWVFLGGGLGSWLRYLITISSNRVLHDFPLGTVIANLAGTFLIGLGSVIITEKQVFHIIRPFFLVGFLGGLTTFSTFANESFILVKEKEYLFFYLYLSLNLVLGFMALVLGRFLARVV